MERIACNILLYVKWIVSGNLLYDSGNSNWGSVTTQRGGMWQEVEGRLLRKGTSIWMYGRSQLNIVIILQLKINNEKIGKKPKTKKNLSLVLFVLSTSRLQVTIESPSLQTLTVHSLSSLLISCLQIPNINSNSGSPKQRSIFLPKSFFVLLQNHI